MKRGKHYSNQPGVRHAVGEFDNARNKPVMGKGPSAAPKWTPHKAEAVTEPAPRASGRAKNRRARAAAILEKAKKGR